MKQLTLASIYREMCPSIEHKKSHSHYKNPLVHLYADERNKVMIDEAPIDFLLDIIDEQCQFYAVNEQVWRLCYFVGSPYEQVLYVSFASCLANNDTDILTDLPEQCHRYAMEFMQQPRKLVNAVFIETTQYQPTQEVIHYASYLIRNTSSLIFDTLTQHSDRFIHVDGRGTVLLSPNENHIHTFHMQVILLALAQAYLLATSAIVSELGECCEEFEPLRRLYKQAVLFNAKSYFACPIKVNRYDAYTLWQDIRKTMPIDDINNEIVQQVESIHRLLSEEEDSRQYQTELKISQRLGWMGISIAGLSLVSVFEITPEKVKEFLNSWWQVFM